MVFGRHGHYDGLEQRRVGGRRRGRGPHAHGRRLGGDRDAGRGVVQRDLERGIAQRRYGIGLGLGGARVQPVRGQGPAQQRRTRFRRLARPAERRASGLLAAASRDDGRRRPAGRAPRRRRVGQQRRRAIRLRGVGTAGLMAGRERQRAGRPGRRLRQR